MLDCQIDNKECLTGRDNVVHDNHLLARLDGIGLHLEEILTIFLVVGLGHTRTGQLALLAHRHKAGAQTQGQTGADQEAAGLEADDDVGLLAIVAGEDVQFQGAQEGLVEGGIGEDGQDILEQDARRGEVRELAQRGAQSYFKTGEFGGAGGRGGGVSGDFGGGMIGGLGHDEKKKGREEG